MAANTLNTTTYNTVAANTVNGAVLSASAILAWRQNVKDVVNQHATEIDGKAAIAQSSFIAPTLLNGWSNTSAGTAVGYKKNTIGEVWLKGRASSGTGVLFILPSGYRPGQKKYFMVYSFDSSFDEAWVTIDTSGNVSLDGGANTQISLDNISFPSA